MNDRYLFKAKTACIVGTSVFPKKEGEWVEGYLRCDCGKWLIYQFEYEYADQIPYEVDPSTICQCAGLKDKNGTLIWENDIVYIRCNGLSGKGVVKFENGCFVLKDYKRNRTYSLFGDWKFRLDGNIFDNPELLEVE